MQNYNYFLQLRPCLNLFEGQTKFDYKNSFLCIRLNENIYVEIYSKPTYFIPKIFNSMDLIII